MVAPIGKPTGVHRESVLREAIGDKYDAIELDNLILDIRNGISDKPNGGNDDEKILQISSVRPFNVDLKKHRYIVNEEKFDKYYLENGDLLITRYNGTRAFVGVAGLFISKEKFFYPDKLIRVRVDQKKVLAAYLMYAINSGSSRQFLEGRIRTTAGQSGISGRDIKQTPIPLPSLPEQHRIVSEIESRLSVAEALEREVAGALARAEGLRMGVLRRAFAGELV